LSFDLAAALRALKPDKHVAHLQRRPDAALRWASDEAPFGAPLLLDTSLYLDVLQGRTPDEADVLLNHRICYHSSVCLAELTHLFGRLDPRHPGTDNVLRTLRGVVEDIPPHRLHAPNEKTWGTAGILAGMLARLSGLSGTEARRFLNDAVIFLQATVLGASVFTGNIRDFDFLNQLVPGGRVILYRRLTP
jgi:hypothetical protein